ncbi:MAG TPA: hypothetical protein VNB23_05890 [Ramlibacter sp.]|nr:hypothetical protein [Ramlibacter sp.]
MKACPRSAFAALLVAALAVAGAARAQPAAAHVERIGDAIHFSGRIEQASAARFLQLLQEPGVRRLVITSGGGLVAPALDMAEALRDARLDIEVPSACLSSCANYLFPAARHKTLGWRGAVGWHGNMAHVLYLQQTGQGSWGEREMQDARQLARREAALFRRLGVDGFVAWFAKIAPYAVSGFYYLSPEDMAGFGIRNVTVQALGRAPADGDPTPVQVDWPRLQADRPLVPLGDAPASQP